MSKIISVKPQGVPREYDYKEHWPYSDRVVKPNPPTVSTRILGQAFIEACIILGMPWDLYLKRKTPPLMWRSIKPRGVGDDDSFVHEHEVTDELSLADLFQLALDEVEDYYLQFGEIDSNYFDKEGNMLLRRPIIGDVVDYVRKSTDNLDPLYGEPTEDRPSRSSFLVHKGFFLPRKGRMCGEATAERSEAIPGFYIEDLPIPFSPDRWDGDARTAAQETDIWYDGANGTAAWDLTIPEQRSYFFGSDVLKTFEGGRRIASWPEERTP